MIFDSKAIIYSLTTHMANNFCTSDFFLDMKWKPTYCTLLRDQYHIRRLITVLATPSVLHVNKSILLDFLQKVFTQATFNSSLEIEAASNIDNYLYIVMPRSIQEHSISSCKNSTEKYVG